MVFNFLFKFSAKLIKFLKMTKNKIIRIYYVCIALVSNIFGLTHKQFRIIHRTDLR